MSGRTARAEISKLTQAEVLKRVDGKVAVVLEESPGEGTDIIIVTWTSNGESFSVQNPPSKDVNVFGIFKSVDQNEYLIERGSEKYGVSETASQGTHLANESIAICPSGVSGSLTSRGKRIWSQTTLGHGVINIGVVVLNVGYSDGEANEAELLDRIHDHAVDAHEEVFYEYSALSTNLDKLAYKTSGNAVDTWTAALKNRIELDYGASDRGEWSPPSVSFVSFVKFIDQYRVILAIGNNVQTMMGLTSMAGGGQGYFNYQNTIVPLNTGDSGIGQEFYVESYNGKIGLRVLGCDFQSGQCGSKFNYYAVDLSKVQIKAPCFLATAASSSPMNQRTLRPLRKFRDDFLTAIPQGKVYHTLYRRHTLEMWRLVESDSTLKKQATKLLHQLSSLVRTWRDDKPLTVTKENLNTVSELAKKMQERASPELRKTLSMFLSDIEQFNGLSLGQVLLLISQKEQES